jgi:cold shock CspA family protein
MTGGIFVHVSDYKDRFVPLEAGMKVRFVEQLRDGKPRAFEVEML